MRTGHILQQRSLAIAKVIVSNGLRLLPEKCVCGIGAISAVLLRCGGGEGFFGLVW